jgi:hypothetical protein
LALAEPPSLEELTRDKLMLDIEKLRAENADRDKLQRWEFTKMITGVVTATAAGTVALIAIATFLLSKL